MKKIPQYVEDDFFAEDDDYKMEWVKEDIQKNFESTTKWLYLGADAVDKTFAKIGLTLGDLSSRSYSSANPDYYIFCAFKFRYNCTEEDIRSVEDRVLDFRKWYRYPENSTKRLTHYESGLLSECFRPVNFMCFLLDLHYELYSKFHQYFVTMEYRGGVVIDCIFSPKLSEGLKKQYLARLVIYE